MTIRELQKHVNATVEANDKAANNRNEMRVCVEMRRDLKRYKTRTFELNLFYRGQTGIGGNQYGAAIHVEECSEVKA